MPEKPDSPFPFQFRICREQKDIRLLTTSNTPSILNFIKLFGLEERIAENIKPLLDTPGKATAVITLHSYPEKGENFAYAALLECDLCGVRKGFFALFKSLSDDLEPLTEECRLMYEFLNDELQKEENRLQEMTSIYPETSSST